jgi:hypothetical protein
VVVPPHEFQKEEKGSGFRAPGFCTRENLLGVGYRHVMIERRGLGRCLDVVLLEWGSENRIMPETSL